MLIKNQIGESFKIHGDSEDNTYIMRGHDPLSGRIWLCVNDPNYEGYNGDLIIGSNGQLVICDNRCTLQNRYLEFVKV